MPRKPIWTNDLIVELLETKYEQYARASFIQDDPIQIPRSFSKREDKELIGFLTATIAWGQRVTIIKNAKRMVTLMDEAPHDFVMNASENEMHAFEHFVHRTFNGGDLLTFLYALRRLMQAYGSMENAFFNGPELPMGQTISRFKQRFFEVEHQARTTKHVADPEKGSSAKRINMYMRWMARTKKRNVDMGIWQKQIIPRLHVPLDVHTGNTARALGLLKRKQNDWKAVKELTERLRKIDAMDPVRFDIPLFALGVYEPELITG